MDMGLEVVVVPVADADRAKDFHVGLGWRLDADVATGEDFRVVQVTPPGSLCSVIFGTGVGAGLGPGPPPGRGGRRNRPGGTDAARGRGE